MKKLMILGVLACAFAVESAAKEIYTAEETHYVTPIEIDLASPLQLPQWSPCTPWRVWGIRLDLIFGRSFCVYGIDAGISGNTLTDVYGIEGTFFNLVGGDVGGIQLGAIANSVRGDVGGIQLGGAANWVRGQFGGIQAALVNVDGAFGGGQLGAFNWNSGICYGFQAGVGNVNVNEYLGVSVGVVNLTTRMHGLQFGFVNEIDEIGDGVQIGVINGAKEFKGVQIGLFNVIQNSELPIMTIVNAHF